MTKSQDVLWFDPDRSYTIAEFCQAERITERFFQRLQKDGYGPVVYCAPGSFQKRISAQSRRDWQRRMEVLNAQDEFARMKRKKRSEDAAKAGERGAAVRFKRKLKASVA